MKNYFKDIRNWYHVFVGISFGYAISVLLFSNRENFPLSFEHWTNFLYPIAVFVLVGGASRIWEYFQDKIRPGVSDMRDVWVSAFSALIGGYLTMIYANIWIGLISTALAIVLVLKHYKK